MGGSQQANRRAWTVLKASLIEGFRPSAQATQHAIVADAIDGKGSVDVTKANIVEPLDCLDIREA